MIQYQEIALPPQQPGSELTAELQGFNLFRNCPRASGLTFHVLLDRIPFHDQVFELNFPIELVFSQEDGLWACEGCGVLSLGATPQDASKEFCEDFAAFWDEIVQHPDEDLSESAQRTKRCMREVVKSVR